ncbi:MAG TPA: SMP-30/gluconolactonase/LRE family protein [Bacteroidales bacterium]|jgi:gluconolactonase|nr:MAG: Gluconolactonase precursor [Bacteroidetes bacterium ADurb.Bin145]HOU03009.1 SMP-30/gluconolactonase/LRE family protein [Bacteroidales bacterium]HQG63319.1 SMP-30/gluconolactonase/LRE family protein [Bacteroidales bacterium]HQK68477.1 SMP-30/gluconolactonase/LRE family protein [Bacteroidales bacterium]
MKQQSTKSIILAGLTVMIAITLSQCTKAPEWQKKNKDLIKQYALAERQLTGLPKIKLESNLDPGIVTNLDNISNTTLYPGVEAKIYWWSGTMVAVLQLKPGAKIPEEVLPSDRFLFVLEGSVDQLINGSSVNMISRKREEQDGAHSVTPRIDFVYLEKDSKNALTAGPDGAKLFEVYSPVRTDYLVKTGIAKVPAAMADLKIPAVPNVVPNKVYDLYNLQFTPLAAGSNSRLITGKNVQISFISMDPGALFDRHIHPEAQTMLVLRGGCNEILLDGEQKMEKDDLVLIPGNMVHGAKVSDLGCDAIDIFWPARADYSAKEKAALEAYHAIIPEDSKLELLVDGTVTKPSITFAEGPKWMNGKIYFSNMGFDQAWGAHPDKSSIVELSPDGSYRNITEGRMQTNGLYPYKNGNLLVCDMIGHRVIEMTTEGRIVRVVADRYEGKKIDGPNDIITDAKGGIYFTDPQFTMEAVKFQPGRAVYYISPEGKITRITEPNEFAMPNGILLSPDGKTLYINNCYDDESWYPVNSDKENYVWAYDVNEDGTISNGRQFAKLFLVDNVLDRKGKSSSSDGMAIDKMGNIYVGTYYGVQIFNPKGEFVGMINLPHFPVSLCFGDEDMKTLYIVSYSWVYKIRTNMEGYVNYL